MNYLGVVAVILGLCAFAFAYDRTRHLPAKLKWMLFCAFALLSIPPVLFAVYYLHVIPEREWFYTFRSWPGTELLVIFLGFATGIWASLLSRWLLAAPLFVFLVVAVVPYVKPLIGPLPDNAFQERWQGDICLQSTPSTCGPACVTTILKRLGAETSEQATARAAFSYSGGTEAWYLARYVRSKGFVARFEFGQTFSPASALPAVVGVRLGGAGHFIAVLNVSGDQVTFADPLQGERRLPVSAFQRRYRFTGFQMAITKS